MAKGGNVQQGENKQSADNSGQQPSKRYPGCAPVLDVIGLKTHGLSRPRRTPQKNVSDYSIAVEQARPPALAAEHQRAKAIKQRIGRLRPGYAVPAGTGFRGLNLSGMDLERVRFDGSALNNARLRHCHLRGVVFKHCNLTGADLRRADLTDCIIDGCDLTGADLRGCRLTNARIVDSNLFAINLDNSQLDHAVIDTCTMGAQSFHNSSCRGIKLYNSQVHHGFFDSADLADADMRHMLFRECTLTNTHFDRAVLDTCYFRFCESDQAGPIFSDCVMRHVTMADCALAESQLVGTHMIHSRMERVTMESALLDGALFDDVVFTEGQLKGCYSLEESPSFNQCQLDHLTIDHTELCNAHFHHSAFIGATIIASDVDAWDMQHTELDSNTTVTR